MTPPEAPGTAGTVEVSGAPGARTTEAAAAAGAAEATGAGEAAGAAGARGIDEAGTAGAHGTDEAGTPEAPGTPEARAAGAAGALGPGTVRALFRVALLRDGRGHRMALTTLAFMLHQLCEALVPVLIGVVIDRAMAPAGRAALFRWLAVLAGVFVVLSLSYQRASSSMVTVYGHGEHELRQRAMTRLLDPRSLRRRPGPGEALSLVSSDAYRVAGVSWSVVQQASALTAILVASAVLLTISVPLGLGVIAGTVLVLVVMHRVSMPLEARGLAEQSAAARAGEVATDMIAGLRVVIGMGGRAEAARRYRAVSDASRHGAVAASRSVLAYGNLGTLLSGVFLAALTTASAWLALDGRLTVGRLVTVLGLAQYLQGALAQAGAFASHWAHKRASARRLGGLMDEPPLLAPGRARHADPAGCSGRDGRHSPDGQDGTAVRWLPPGHRAPLDLRPGDLVGVVPRDPAHARDLSDRLGYRVPLGRGELLIGGADAVDLGPERVRARITAPPHHGAVFSGTLRSNLVPEGQEPDPAVLGAVVLDDVLEHIGGDRAEVGEHGRRLSGGQRQRLLLARALHTGAGLVVLDEPTTAIDPVTEQRVAEGLRGLPATVLLITASPILLSVCDRVVVLDGDDHAHDHDPKGTHR